MRIEIHFRIFTILVCLLLFPLSSTMKILPDGAFLEKLESQLHFVLLLKADLIYQYIRFFQRGTGDSHTSRLRPNIQCQQFLGTINPTQSQLHCKSTHFLPLHFIIMNIILAILPQFNFIIFISYFLQFLMNTQPFQPLQTFRKQNPNPRKIPTETSFKVTKNRKQNRKSIDDSITGIKNQPLSSRTSQNFNKTMPHNKYPSNVSLMKEDASLLSIAFPDLSDLTTSLLSLQCELTQTILGLRQDKLTLKEQYSKIIGQRLGMERILKKIQKENNKKQTQPVKISDPEILDQPKYNNQLDQNDLTLNLQLFQVNDENQHLIDRVQSIITETQRVSQQALVSQIEKLQQSSRVIQIKINQLYTNSSRDLQKFQPFQPQNNKTFESNNQQILEHKKLNEYKHQMLINLADRVPNYNQRSQFYKLIHQNRQITKRYYKVYSEIGYSSTKSIEFLKKQFIREQDDKDRFFYELQKFKNTMDEYRKQNQYMKSKLCI